jgi:hypothetical protein
MSQLLRVRMPTPVMRQQALVTKIGMYLRRRPVPFLAMTGTEEAMA